jgi:hypothetical protein
VGVVDALGLRVRQGEPQLVDHLGPHGNPFPPAVVADLRVDCLPLLVAEGGSRQLRTHLPAAAAQDLPLADLLCGRGRQLGYGRAQRRQSPGHLGAEAEFPALGGDLDAAREHFYGARALAQALQTGGPLVVGPAHRRLKLENACEALRGLLPLPGIRQGPAQGPVAQFVVRIILGHLAELLDPPGRVVEGLLHAGIIEQTGGRQGGGPR